MLNAYRMLQFVPHQLFFFRSPSLHFQESGFQLCEKVRIAKSEDFANTNLKTLAEIITFMAD